jgi:hypothetical protein
LLSLFLHWKRSAILAKLFSMSSTHFPTQPPLPATPPSFPSPPPPQPAPLTPTDQKVYAFAILKNTLVLAAVIVGTVSFVCALCVNPVWVLGIIAAIALGTLGLLIETDAVSSLFSSSRAFIPKQPPGLRNSSNNCWINSAFQLFANIPEAREIAEKHRLKLEKRGKSAWGQILPAALSTYQSEYQANLRGTGQYIRSALDTHSLRAWLYDVTDSALACPKGQGAVTSRTGSAQEAAIEFFQEVMPPLPICAEVQNYNLSDPHTITNNPEPNTAEAPPLISLDLRINTNTPFNEKLNNYFVEELPSSSPLEGRRKVRYFTAAPESVLIQLERYAPGATVPIKITNPVVVPLNLSLSIQSQTVPYKCQGFIMHGGNLSFGHYIACVCKQGQWWYISDESVQQVTEAYALNQMPNGDIFHFAKEGLQA